MYLITHCPNCGRLMMANSENKTRRCPSCGHSSQIRTLHVIARVRDQRDAVEMIQKLKESKRKGDSSPQFKKFRQ